jgi:hypothetical protein
MFNVCNGFLIINEMMIQRNKPDFRTDVDFENHVVQLFTHFTDYAISKKLTIILTGRCIKSPSIKQALLVAALKSRCDLVVAQWESHLVNPALIEMNCIEVLNVDNVNFNDGKLYVSDMPPSNIDSYETIVLLNSQPKVMYKTASGWKSMPIPTSLQKVDGEFGGAVEIIKSRIKPKIVSAVYDDSDVIKDVVDVNRNIIDFGFIEQLKNLNQRHLEIDIAELDFAVSPLQQVLNSMPMTYATEQVQSLFNDASLDVKTQGY